MPPIAGLALGGASSILGGILGGNAASKASKAQMAMAMKAANLGTQSRDWANSVFDQNLGQANNQLEQARQNWSPFVQGGLQGFNALTAALGPGGDLTQKFGDFKAPTGVDYTNDPGYQFRLQQGQDAIQRSAAARGGMLSGDTARQLNDYSQGTASQEYGNVYNRALNTYGTNFNTFQANQGNEFARLMGLTNVGETAAGADSNLLAQEGANWMTHGQEVGGNIMNTANMVGNDYMGAGNAAASGIMGRNNAYMGALNGLSGMGGFYSMMNTNGGGAGANTVSPNIFGSSTAAFNPGFNSFMTGSNLPMNWQGASIPGYSPTPDPFNSSSYAH